MQENIKKDEIEIDLGQIFKSLFNKIWIMAIAFLLAGIVAMSATNMFVTPKYSSNSKLYINSGGVSLGNLNLASIELEASNGMINTYEIILFTRTTLNSIIEEAGLDYNYKQLSKMLTLKSVNNTGIVQIEATSENPSEATLIANTAAKVLPTKITETIVECYVTVVDLAIDGETPISPSPTRNSVIAGMLAAMLVAAVVVVKTLLNQKITSEDELYGLTKFPVLAVVPDNNSKDSKTYYYKKNN